MNVAVIGVGYVGLVSAACFAELGHTVVAVDNDPAKVAMLDAGHMPIHEDLAPGTGQAPSWRTASLFEAISARRQATRM